MTEVLYREDVLGVRPSDTVISLDAILALRTRGQRPEQRLAKRLLSELDDFTEFVDETLAYEAGTYAEVRDFGYAFPPQWQTTSGSPRGEHRAQEPLLPAAAERALDALKVVVQNLAISETEAATTVGVSRNTVRGWREGRAPYPATTRRLFNVANLLEAVERSGARVVEWLDQPASDGRLRRQVLMDEDGPAVLARDASDLLFGRRPIRTIADDLPEFEELRSSDTDLAPESSFEFHASPRRRRR